MAEITVTSELLRVHAGYGITGLCQACQDRLFAPGGEA